MKREEVKVGTVLTVRDDLEEFDKDSSNTGVVDEMIQYKNKKLIVFELVNDGVTNMFTVLENDWLWEWGMFKESQMKKSPPKHLTSTPFESPQSKPIKSPQPIIEDTDSELIIYLGNYTCYYNKDFNVIGMSNCSKEDNYDKLVGKAIAYYKAFHKE